MKNAVIYLIIFFTTGLTGFSQETGFITGSLTDQYTGEPLFGVKVKAWEQGGLKAWKLGSVEAGKSLIYVILSDDDGDFGLELPVGVYQAKFSRYGLDEMEISDIVVLANDTVILDTTMVAVEVPVAAVIANTDQLNLEVQWYPSGPSLFETSMDYGPLSDYFVFQEPGNQVAVKFDNYNDHIIGGRIFVGDGSFPGTFLGTDFLLRIYDDEGMEGLPGNTIFEDTVTVDQYGWVGLDNLDAFTLMDHFYLSMYQLNEASDCAPIGCTQYPANSSSLMKLGNYNWVPFPLGNAMIRAWVSAPHDSVFVTNYRVGRYSNFDPEGDPQSGTLSELASTNNLSYIDYAWGGIPYGCYAYGIKALYSNGCYSPVRISNIVYNPPPCSPSFLIEQSDGSLSGTCHVSLTGLTQPFKSYSLLPQTPGTINFSSVKMGKYLVSIYKPGYDKIVMDSVELYSDTLIELTLQETPYPITDLKVNEFTGKLNWEPEFIYQFDWRCDADSICHELVTPELDLLYLNQWIMTVTYRYPVDYDPAYVEYSTDQGRTWAIFYEFPEQENWTTIDIELSLFPLESDGSGIMFQIHDVFGSPFYLDISQVKVWLPDIRVHAENYFITLDEVLEGQSDSTFYQLNNLVNGQTYLAGVKADYSTGTTDTAIVEFTYHELFPPENFSWSEENDTLKFSWAEPSGSWNTGNEDGEYPDALAGYILTYSTSDTHLKFEIDDPSENFFSFEKPDCDTATAMLTAVYDLSEYGYTGNLFESKPAGPLQITFGGPFENEFLEDWTVISFVHNCWKVTGDGLAIEAGEGNPGPALVYENLPAHYQVFLTSFPINMPRSIDATLFLEFDLNLFCSGQSGYEIMEFQVNQDGSDYWEMVQGISNSLGNIDWLHFKVDLSRFIETDLFRFRLKFEGIGAEPVQWKIDNIRVHQVCPGPLTVYAQPVSETDILLNWDKPVENDNSRDLALYRIYREYNDSGFQLFSETADTFYIDQLNTSGKYCYRVAAVYDDQGVFCESPESDTACVISTLGIRDEDTNGGILCYPNPAKEYITIQSKRELKKISLYNSTGSLVSKTENAGINYKIEMKGLPQGIYLLQMETDYGSYFSKFIH